MCSFVALNGISPKPSILESSHNDLDIPDDVGINEFIFREVDKHRNKIAIIEDATGEQITYESLNEKISSLACALYQRGTRRGDLVCLYTRKTIPSIIAAFAITKLGAIACGCNPSQTSGEFAIQANKSRSKIIIADKTLMVNVLKVLQDIPSVTSVYTDGEFNGYECLNDMMKLPNNGNIQLGVTINSKEDTAFVIFSSGSTGTPKGVMVTHYNLVTTVAILRCPHLGLTTHDVFFHLSDPFQMQGLEIICASLAEKKTLVLIELESIFQYKEKVKQYQMDHLVIWPHLLRQISTITKQEIAQAGLDFKGLKVLTGGAPVSAKLTVDVLAKTGATCLLQGYGSTECSVGAALDLEEHSVPGSAGLVFPHTKIKIVDVNTGEILGAFQRGEVCVKGPQVMKGYLYNPEATKQAIDTDGWLHMGDLGYYDETGHLFIVDRLKEVIMYQIQQISPTEIEEVIYTHPAVKSVCVVGVEDDKAGEVPLACVIVKDGHSVTEQEIVKLVEENVADRRRLRGGVKFMKEFPRTSNGKISRKQLKDMIKEDTQKEV